MIFILNNTQLRINSMRQKQVLSRPFINVLDDSKLSQSGKQVTIYTTPESIGTNLPAPNPPAISTVVPLKNNCRLIWLFVISGMGPAYVGYLLYIGFFAHYSSYQSVYNIPQYLSRPLVVTMILAAVPLGGCFSPLLLPEALKIVNKRTIVFVFFGFSVAFCLVTCVPNFIALLIGRIGLGFLCAWQNTIGAVLLRDLSPLHYRQPSTAFFFTTRTFGMACCFLISTIFRYELNYTQFCVFGCIPAMIALVQVVCVLIFLPVLPTELIKQEDRLRVYYSDLYSSEDVNQATQNCINQFKDMDKEFAYVHNGKTNQEKEIALDLYKKIQNRALFASLYATAVRQFCGINYVVMFGNFCWQNAGFDNFYLAGNFVMSLIQFVFTFLGLFIFYRFSRRSVYLVGGLGCIAAGLTMAICDLLQVYIGVVVGQIAYIVFMSTTINPVVWPYPIQVIPPAQAKWSSFVNWVTGFLITIVPVRRVSYQFFFAITAFMILSEIVCYFFLAQSQNLTLREVFTNFMKEAYGESKSDYLQLQIQKPFKQKKKKKKLFRNR